MVIRGAEGPRQVAAETAFLYRILDLALKENSSARDAFKELKALLNDMNPEQSGLPGEFHVQFVRPGSVNSALEILKMARIRDRHREDRANVALEPWLVEAALARLGDRQLTAEEQEVVWAATRTPTEARNSRSTAEPVVTWIVCSRARPGDPARVPTRRAVRHHGRQHVDPTILADELRHHPDAPLPDDLRQWIIEYLDGTIRPKRGRPSRPPHEKLHEKLMWQVAYQRYLDEGTSEFSRTTRVERPAEAPGAAEARGPP